MSSRDYKCVPVPPDHFKWIWNRTRVVITADFVAIAAVNTERMSLCEVCNTLHEPILGMVGYSDWTANSANMHYALDEPVAARLLLKASFDYLFRQCGRRIAIGVTRATNERALKINRRLGFKPLVTIVDGFADGEDIIIQRLDKADWEVKYGK